MLLSPNDLARCMGCNLPTATNWVNDINIYASKFKVNSRMRLAMALAQIGHETGGLHWIEELWGPTPVQKGYEGRMDLGNLRPGDGSKFRGRGLLQVTGRAGYVEARDYLRLELDSEVPDFEEHPELLTTSTWAAASAFGYWQRKGLNELSDAGDLKGATRRINGGLNGVEDRQERYIRCLGIVT